MSKWSRLKVAVLTAGAALSAVQVAGGCAIGGGGGFGWLESNFGRILQLVTIANIWD